MPADPSPVGRRRLEARVVADRRRRPEHGLMSTAGSHQRRLPGHLAAQRRYERPACWWAARAIPLVYIHGAGGLMWDPFVDALASQSPVYAPEHPGSGESTGLEELRDLWDLVLYYNDLLDALELAVGPRRRATRSAGWWRPSWRPTTRSGSTKLVLIAPIGLWRDDAPVPDIAGIPAEKLPALVLADPNSPLAAVPAPRPIDDPEALFQAAHADGQHPALHLADPRQGPRPADAPGAGADAARLGQAGRARATRLRRRVRLADRATPRSPWSTTPVTSPSSSSPSRCASASCPSWPERSSPCRSIRNVPRCSTRWPRWAPRPPRRCRSRTTGPSSPASPRCPGRSRSWPGSKTSWCPVPAATSPCGCTCPPATARFPTVVFFHGGGWVIGDIDTHDVPVRRLANLVPARGRVGRLPAGARASVPGRAAGLLRRHGVGGRTTPASYSGDGRRLAVAGDSAGGNLAAVVAQMARDQGGPPIAFQLLVYPAVDARMTHASMTENGDGYLLTKGFMEWFYGHYLPRSRRRRPAGVAHQGRRRSPACRRPWCSPPSSTRCATRARPTPPRCKAAGGDGHGQALRRHDPRVHPARWRRRPQQGAHGRLRRSAPRGASPEPSRTDAFCAR